MLFSYAQVSIKLRNRGQDAYKPKEYGDCITVERRISSDGSGSYKLKAKDGNLDIVQVSLIKDVVTVSDLNNIHSVINAPYIVHVINAS